MPLPSKPGAFSRSLISWLEVRQLFLGKHSNILKNVGISAGGIEGSNVGKCKTGVGVGSRHCLRWEGRKV